MASPVSIHREPLRLERPRPVTFPAREGKQVALRSPAHHRLIANVIACAARGLPMSPAGAHEGRTAVVVGTGPSLDRRENRRAVKRWAEAGAVVYALKSAVTILEANGIRADYIVNCDAQANQVAKMPLLPRPTYLLGSCCDPALFDHVLGGGCRVEVFHSACGGQVTEHGSEVDWYRSLFPAPVWVAQGGMTVANRAVAVAYHHGCRRVLLAGADFGVRDKARYYAEGASGRLGPSTLWVTDDGYSDGVPWYSQPSLVLSAVSVARLMRAGFVEVIGDSLAAALARNSKALDRAAHGAV